MRQTGAAALGPKTSGHGGLQPGWPIPSGRGVLWGGADSGCSHRQSGRAGTARLWDASTGLPYGSSFKHPSWVTAAAFSPDGRRLITGCSDHKARVWEVETGRRIPPDLGHLDGVSSVEFSPDGRLLLT